MQDQLHDEGLLPDPRHVAILLDADALVINDVRQPEHIRYRYAARYLKNAGSSISYAYDRTDD